VKTLAAGEIMIGWERLFATLAAGGKSVIF
jgi:hypothetical protein